MKKGMILLAGFVLLLTSFAAAPLASASSDQNQILIEADASSASQGQGPDANIHQNTLEALSDSDLSESEIQGILFMREEEKLARDVYLALADKWGMNIFRNIAGSENTHMDAILTLIDLADLEDPAGDTAPGEFENEDLQALYIDLIARGNMSLDEALLVGGAIEEIDILDLQDYLVGTDHAAVIAVYQNLLKGSINHLKVFVRAYQRQTGESYQPQFMTPEVYDELMSSAAVRSSGGGMGMNSGSQGRGQGRSY